MRSFKDQLSAVTVGTLKSWLEANPWKTFNLFFRKGITASFSIWNDQFCEIIFHKPRDSKPLAFHKNKKSNENDLHNEKSNEDDDLFGEYTPMKVLCPFDEIEERMAKAERYAFEKTKAMLALGMDLYSIPSEAYKVFEYLYKWKKK